MANTLRGLQGLLGGLSGGLEGFVRQRDAQTEQARQQKLLQLQEAQNLRAQQAQEFEELQAAYRAANPDMDLDPELGQKFAGKFPLLKSDSGGFRRPYSIEEQSQNAQRKLAELNITEEGRKQKALELLRTNPTLMNAPQSEVQRFLLQQGLITNVSALPSDIQTEAAAKFAPELAGRKELAGIENAAQMARTLQQTAAQRYAADQMALGRGVTADLRSDANYNSWKTGYLKSNLQAAREYNQIAREKGPGLAEEVLLRQYKLLFPSSP